MPEPVTALADVRFEGIAIIAAAPTADMVTLRADLAARKVQAAVKQAVGVAVPAPLCANMRDGCGAGWMSPDELLLFVPRGEGAAKVAALDTALAGLHAAAADVSDARAAFRISGPAAREVLAKLTPADMAPGVFPPGGFRRTRLAQVPVAIRADADGFTLLCFRSVAGYVFDLLSGAAAPGSAVGYFAPGA
ncbi:sarcosine oxidase subunit gamma [Rhodovulum steppense]|uniref:Sarcosine oxidase subunit gamma n=1 Tax=Rhodovulum steppense TaxID=540251 RepID=A0A4R1YTL9_9RHOB|nr:sarcosine oxidase subunit gamma family protein [Rhodovulum steppense]TCM83404.1 sarcosine oxidase subunit gamma [Rhodovulum steppense]